MQFEVDVSGKDLLSPGYVICVANEKYVKGFKIDNSFVRKVNSRFGQGLYRYKKSRKGKVDLKIRIYCVVIYYLVKALSVSGAISLVLCRDFDGRENDIIFNLKSFLDVKIRFCKLENDSPAHENAYLMSKGRKKCMKISLKEIEKYLK